jgi:hypothetical protein
MLSAQAVINDYPADPAQILGDLHRINPTMVLSLELFNPAYWKGDPLETARTGLAKMKQVVREAGAA